MSKPAVNQPIKNLRRACSDSPLPRAQEEQRHLLGTAGQWLGRLSRRRDCPPYRGRRHLPGQIMVSVVLTDSPVVKSADSSVCGRVSFIYGPGATMHRALTGRDPSYGALWFQPGQSPVRTRSPAPFSPKWICKFFNTAFPRCRLLKNTATESTCW